MERNRTKFLQTNGRDRQSTQVPRGSPKTLFPHKYNKLYYWYVTSVKFFLI